MLYKLNCNCWEPSFLPLSDLKSPCLQFVSRSIKIFISSKAFWILFWRLFTLGVISFMESKNNWNYGRLKVAMLFFKHEWQKTNVFLFYFHWTSLKAKQLQCWRKTTRHGQVNSPGADRWSRAAAYTFCSIPSHLPSRSNRQHDMILLIRSDSVLQGTSFLVTSPLWISIRQAQMLACFVPKTKTTSFIDCFFQFYFFITLGITDYYMFIVMAFDHFTGVRKPSLPCYIGNKMSRRVCLSGYWSLYIRLCRWSAWTIPIPPSPGPKEINHFYCVDPTS